MRLDEFKAGDKVRFNEYKGEVPPHIYSEILYIGKQNILLRNWRGVEFLRERTAEGFELWRPKLTYDELLAENKKLRFAGDDMMQAIENAAWTDSKDKPNLHGQTAHMSYAVALWKEITRV